MPFLRKYKIVNDSAFIAIILIEIIKKHCPKYYKK